jgi:hypothetical protein
MNATVNVGTLLPANVFQSRWGFHPVSREIDKKLRFLNTVYQRALRMAATWRRWERKAPHNRVTRPKVKDSSGQVIGYGEPTPWNEPAICPIFTSKITKKVQWHPTLGYHKDGIDYTYVETHGEEILAAARQARTPCPTPEAVRPLSLTVEEINSLYDRAVEWMATRK